MNGYSVTLRRREMRGFLRSAESGRLEAGATVVPPSWRRGRLEACTTMARLSRRGAGIVSMLVVTALLSHVPAGLGADGFPKWPLRNGDFSTSHGWGRPSDWEPATNSGKYKFLMDPPAPFWGRPSSAVLEAVEGGSAYYFQKLSLMKGKYRLSVDVSGSKGSQARVNFVSGSERFDSEPIDVDDAWQTVSLDVSADNGEASVSLMAISPAGASVKFRRIRLEIKELESAPVAVEDGQLGALVLPDDPSLAEQYACYELQRYISRMTGATLGLKGRDKVFDGERVVYLGRAAQEQRSKLKDLPADSYLIHSTADQLVLAGKADQGTLYAVYDFLSQQGCRWIIPGPLGEIIPKRQALAACQSKVESPDYDCRGFMALSQDFNPGGGEEFGWIGIKLDDHFDWYVRNRLNIAWFAGAETYDFGAHRAHGWVQLLNHSYNGLVAPHGAHFKDHPDWYPLVRGKRMPVCDIGPKFVNQLCVSNKGLRDYTVEMVLDYFKKNPRARAFPLNPMDGPSFWCECDECKALDPPGVDWSRHATEGQVMGMADRALNYASEVAERVAKVYPDKMIEMYAYGYTLEPPVRQKAHKNVFVKYANLRQGEGNGPLGRSMMDPDAPIWPAWREQLDGWKKADARLAFYNYMEWQHPDVTLFWFYNGVDVLKTLNRQYNCRILAGETENNILISTMVYNVMARALWDLDVDYKAVIRDLCDNFYGPVADELYGYNMMMDEAIRKSTAWEQEGWRPNDHLYLSLEVLEKGRRVLDEAAGKVKDDAALTKRLAYARVGHAYLTYVRALKDKHKTAATAEIARQAFDSANALRLEHAIMVKLPSVRQLKTFYYPPVVDDAAVVLRLPVAWDFKKDADDAGLTEKWYLRDVDASWSKIEIEKDWTAQDAGRGYHGTAWYHIRFELPAGTPKQSRLSLHFGAVDGYADIFLDRAKIGEQKRAPGVMWDKPFKIPLPADLDPTKPHELTIRVRKESFAAGVWRPVRIIREGAGSDGGAR